MTTKHMCVLNYFKNEKIRQQEIANRQIGEEILQND